LVGVVWGVFLFFFDFSLGVVFWVGCVGGVCFFGGGVGWGGGG